MKEFKNLNITVDKIEKIIAEFVSKANGKYEVEEKPNKTYHIKIIVPGQRETLLIIYNTKKGVTVDPKVGVNQKLSLELAELIKKHSRKVETAQQNFEGVFQELFDEFKNELREIGIEIEQDKDEFKEALKLKNQYGHELTVTYYKSSHKVLIQGKTTKLYDDVVLWFVDKVISNPEDIVKIVFNSFDDFKKYEYQFPADWVDRQLEEKLGIIYKDERIVNDSERKWLQTSFYLLHTQKELPEYYPVIAGAIKVIEGILRRILINKCGVNSFAKKTGAFLQFDYDRNSERYKLKDKYEHIFSNNEKDYILEMYEFLKKVRDNLNHNPGISPYVIKNRKEAEDIFDRVIDLIKSIEGLIEGLLNEEN